MKLPDELLNYIKVNGYSCLNGYLKLLKEDEIKSIFEIIQKNDNWNDGIPFAVTAFGDVLVLSKDNFIYKYQLIMDEKEVILSGFKFFFKNIEDKEYQKDYFDLDLYEEAINKYGRLNDGECFVLEPLPAFGGALDIKYVNKGTLLEYIKLLVS